jgi:glyoxylase-like metal-dependent hydrolase (beta-lactamase superfamily II)
MIFFLGETPDGWGIPGIHGMLAEDELDGYVQGAVYLIRGKGENLLIDTGNWSLPEFNNGMGDFLVEQLDKEKNKLKYIFLTHFHYDHVGNSAALKERYGAEVICHPLDRPIIEDPLIVTRPENVTRFGITPQQLLEDFNLQPGESLGLSDPEIIRKYWNFPVKVDRTVEDGDLIEFGGLKVQTIHLPGHAPGQIGLWNPESRTLYSADLLHYPTPLGPYPIGNAKAHSRSIQKCLDLAPDLLLEGHGLSAYSATSSKRRLVHMQMQQRDTRDRILLVLRRFNRSATIVELLPEVLPIKTDLDYPVSTGIGEARAYAKACIQCHLVWLVEDGLVQRVKEDGKIAFFAKS